MDDLIDALQRMLDQRLSEVNTSAPGRIVSINGNRAVVRPDMSKLLADGTPLPPPNIVSVPIVWPGASGGEASMTMPLKPGDGVVLLFSQRSLEDWLNGNAEAPSDPRMFDITDAIAIPGLSASASAPDPNDVVIRHGAGVIRMTPDGSISIGNGAGSLTISAGGDLTLNFPNVTSASDIRAAGISLQTHTHPENDSTTGPPNA